jgi:hypothetical protein
MMSDDYLKWYAAVDGTIAMVRMVERGEFNASAFRHCGFDVDRLISAHRRSIAKRLS